MRLVDAYLEPGAADFLYRLMAERPPESWISHTRLPTRDQHADFFDSRPFRYWELILRDDETMLGAIECKDTNEFGVSILAEYQRRGYGSAAVILFMATHTPLPEIKAIRSGHWLANIATHNEYSKSFFKGLGFAPVQETWQRHD